MPELIAPAKPTPYEIMELSEIDNHGHCHLGHMPGIHFYGSAPNMLAADPAKVTKEALIKKNLGTVLSFSGALKGKKVIRNWGEALWFSGSVVSWKATFQPTITLSTTEAEYMALTAAPKEGIWLKGLADFHKPIPCMNELLYNGVPDFVGILNSPLFLFQVTRLKCGGFIITHKMNHSIVNAIGVADFMNAISESRSDKGTSSSGVTPPPSPTQILLAGVESLQKAMENMREDQRKADAEVRRRDRELWAQIDLLKQ
ncbi:benzyl alcohol O-benzoyltransferase-like [Silene latifolia]|uniref:benzyl alcohol O-benzoyltransferase-like n=1 Tax=Silene latifolia TaxID=37657 RepID=UPI003D777C96